jgi:hypothetical protein
LMLRLCVPRVDCTPCLRLVKVTEKVLMSVKILSDARFAVSQAQNRDCGIRRTGTAMLDLGHTECRTFTGAEEYRLAMG